MNKESYEWNYCSLGGVIRVKIASGEDLEHLGELDQKYWTLLIALLGKERGCMIPQYVF